MAGPIFAGCNIRPHGQTALFCTAEPTIAKLLLDAGLDANARSTYSLETALHRVASRQGCKLALLCHMIKAGCDLLAVDKWGSTAAQVAEARGNSQVAQFLSRETEKLTAAAALQGATSSSSSSSSSSSNSGSSSGSSV